MQINPPETRTFAGLGSNQYTISYGYNVSGALTSITDPSGAQVGYNYNQAGQLTSMPASGYSGVTNFLSNLQYRAFGGMKHATYGNSVQVDLTYNQRLQIGQYQASGFHTYNGTPYSMGATMSYYDDGRTNSAFDLNDAKFDRKYEFDFSARLKEAYSGVEAHGQPAPPLNQANSPYRQSYTYNEFNDVLTRSGRVWTQNDADSASYTSDNKRQGWTYDNAGSALTTFDGTYTYDAAERPVSFTSFQNWQIYPGWPSNHPDGPALETWDTFDGTGQIAKHVNHTRVDESYDDGEYGFNYWVNDSTTTTYYVHSTVLGGKTIEELNQNGTKTTGYVYSGGARVATQHVYVGSSSVALESTNPVTGAAITTDVNAAYALRQELDPLGRDLASPPDPGLVSAPLNNPLLKDQFMPIEYTGGPSAYYEEGNAWWAGVMAIQTWQYQHGYFDKGGYFDIKNQFINAVVNQHFGEAAQILAKNPNFFIELNGKMTAGQSAANAFTTALANLPGDPLGMRQNDSSQRYTPQNPSRGMKGAAKGATDGGDVDFTGDEKKILKQVNDRINETDCKDFINKILTDNRVAGDRNTFEKLLATVDINKYSEDLTNRQLNVSMDGMISLRDAFNNQGAPAATVGNHIFFVELAFRRETTGLLPSWGTHNRSFDTATIMVHELFHVAGLKDPQVQNMNRQIHEHCGFTGMDY